MRPATKAAPAVLAAGLSVSTLLGLLTVHAPLARDQGVAAYVAAVMDQGGAPYRDVYHFNLPASFFVYRAAELLGLPLPERVNATQVIFSGLTLLLVYFIGKRIASPLAAAFGAAGYGLFQAALYTDYWDVAQKESLAAPALALSLYALLAAADRGQDGARPLGPTALWAALAGLGAGLAAQFKPTLGIVLLSALQLAWGFRGQKARALAIALAAGLGFGISFAPLVYYLAAHDLVPVFLDSFIRFGGFYGGQYYQGPADLLFSAAKNLGLWLYRWSFLLVPAGYALIARAGRRPAAGLVAGFGALLLVQVIAQMKFFTYHWIPLLVPVSALAAAGAAELVGAGEAEPAAVPRRFRAALAVALVALLAANLAPEAKRYYRHVLYDQGQIDETSFLRPYGKWGEGDINPLATREAANYLRSHSSPTDPILVFGHELGLYVLARRFAPTRFAYDQPLTTDPAGDQKFAAYREQLRDEFIADLAKRPPLYILVVENDETGIEPKDSYTQMGEFPKLRELIDRDYGLETKIEDFYIYRRQPAAEERRPG